MDECALLDLEVMVGIIHFLSDASKVFHWLLQVLKFERTGYNLVLQHSVKHITPFAEILCCHCNTEYSLVNEIAAPCVAYSCGKRQKCLLLNMCFIFSCWQDSWFLEAPSNLSLWMTIFGHHCSTCKLTSS